MSSRRRRRVQWGRTYRVNAQSTRGGQAQAAAKARTIEFDASAGQSDTLPGPADLLTAAFAACVLMNVERFSQILHFRYERASIEVEVDRQDAPPRMTAVRYVLRVVTNDRPQRVELLNNNFRRHGTICAPVVAIVHRAFT